MKDGFVKVGCTSFNLEVGNVNHNTNEIIKCLNRAKKSEVKILVFPEFLYLRPKVLKEVMTA